MQAIQPQQNTTSLDPNAQGKDGYDSKLITSLDQATSSPTSEQDILNSKSKIEQLSSEKTTAQQIVDDNKPVNRGSTVELLTECNKGAEEACTQLDERNQQDLSQGLAFIKTHYPEVIERLESMPDIEFNNSLEFFNNAYGDTGTITGDIRLSSGYASTAELTGVLAHELLHSGDGIGDRIQTNIQDWLNPVKDELGEHHDFITDFGKNVENTFWSQCARTK
jgi:Na+-translocating ferredoxin:NAD+ oxidoreductase RnfG subunit